MTHVLDNPGYAKDLVFDLLKKKLIDDDIHPTFSVDEVLVVWFCYILGGWKALITTTLPYGMYYEVTHNQNSDQTYIDIYKKVDQVVITSQ